MFACDTVSYHVPFLLGCSWLCHRRGLRFIFQSLYIWSRAFFVDSAARASKKVTGRHFQPPLGQTLNQQSNRTMPWSWTGHDWNRAGGTKHWTICWWRHMTMRSRFFRRLNFTALSAWTCLSSCGPIMTIMIVDKFSERQTSVNSARQFVTTEINYDWRGDNRTCS